MARTICIIDDDAAVRDSLRVLLESHGWAVADFASTGEFLTRRHGDKSAALLILDQHLPGASGLEFLGAHGAGLGLPVILITGASDNNLREQAYRRGVAAYLEKPLAETRLLDAIARALGDAAGPRA
ncbi:MAG TPA: response regulator [Stellaceae bacterium]|nr:response regulator [Stellaceae bacterium]